MVDRSGRRTAVIAWTITVGAMFGGATATAAPALADERGPDSAGGVNVAEPHRAPVRTQVRAPGRTEVPPAPPSPGVRGRGPADPPSPTPPPVPPYPCLWWCPPLSAPPARNSQGGIVVGVPSMPAVTPVPVFGNGRIAGGTPPDGDIGLSLPPLPAPESPPAGGPVTGAVPPAQGPGVPSALVAPSPVVPPAVPVVGAAPVGPPALSVPDMPAPGSVGPVPAAPATRPAPPQRPEPPLRLPELRPDELGRIAATALPGLAALVGMTLFGAVIGYRQARAGYQLRAAGAGRFLQ